MQKAHEQFCIAEIGLRRSTVANPFRTLVCFQRKILTMKKFCHSNKSLEGFHYENYFPLEFTIIRPSLEITRFWHWGNLDCPNIN